jgi:hypothetical protein
VSRFPRLCEYEQILGSILIWQIWQMVCAKWFGLVWRLLKMFNDAQDSLELPGNANERDLGVSWSPIS